jgi:hypothetical protein
MHDLFGARISLFRRRPADDVEEFLTSSVCAIFTAMVTSLGFDAVVISVAVRAYCGRMATEGCDFDLHKGKKRERCKELMQFVGALNVEDADVRVLPNNPP